MEKQSPKDIAHFKDVFIEMYMAGKSTYYIADEYNTHPSYIRDILKKNNIKLRTLREGNHLRFANHTKLSSETLEILNGWMLGDGHIGFTGVQALFSLNTKHEEYADYVINILQYDGLKCRKYRMFNKEFNKYYYGVRTAS